MKNVDEIIRPSGDPLIASAATFAGTAISAIPLAGPFISAGVMAYLQRDASVKLNAAFEEIDRRIRKSQKSVGELLTDPLFRAGIAQLYLSIASHEAESKHRRIQMFLAHRIVGTSTGEIFGEAVLRAFATLPASHIEGFLKVLGDADTQELRDFSARRGEEEVAIPAIVNSEFCDSDDQDHCGSPADIRYRELFVLFASLETVGLLRKSPGPRVDTHYQTTPLAHEFVWHCLEPREGAA